MELTSCSRCGSAGAALERAPLPGDVGQAIVAQTCVDCWREWLRMQVKLINEYHLSPAKREDYQRLLGEMKTFLALRDE